MKFIKESLLKFKNDFLSKIYYDILKFLLVTYLLSWILKNIPTVKTFLALKTEVNNWGILTFSLLLIAFCLTVSYKIFHNRYKRLQNETKTDDLTKLKNHKALEEDLQNLEQHINPKDLPVTIILMDVDNFKKFNDDNSYEIADRILGKLGAVLAKDNRITDDTYRYFMRGDEFLVVARQTNLSNAKIAADRKRLMIAASVFEIDGREYKVTVSCGVTEWSTGEKKKDVLNRADRALKNAKKQQSKNCTEIIV